MYRLQLVKELKTQLAHVLRVPLIVFEPASKATRPHEQLTRGAAVAVRLFARERFVRDSLQKPLAHADPRDGKEPQIQVASEVDKNNGGDAHHVGAVSAHPISLHAIVHVALEHVGQTLPQQGELDRL